MILTLENMVTLPFNHLARVEVITLFQILVRYTEEHIILKCLAKSKTERYLP